MSRAQTSLVWVENRNAVECHPDCGFDTWRMNSDGSGATVVGRSPTRNAAWTSWTRDGRRLVYVYKSTVAGAEVSELRVADGDLSGDRRLLDLPGVSVAPEWSADGSQVVFANYPDGRAPGRESDLFVVAPDGAGFRRVAALPGTEEEPSFSADGKRIVFVHVEPYSGFAPPPPQVWSLAVDGTDLRRHTEGDMSVLIHNVAYSPDGASFAFVAGGQLAVVPTAGGSARAVGGFAATAPAWSPDGTQLAFVRLGGGGPADNGLWTVPLAPVDAKPRLLRTNFQTQYGIQGADWVSDGPLPTIGRDEHPPVVALARVVKRRAPPRVSFGPTSGSAGSRRELVVRNPNELRFLAADQSGLGRLVARIRRLAGDRPRPAGRRRVLRSAADWRRLVRGLRRGRYGVRFRVSDVGGRTSLTRRLRVRVR